MSPSFTFIEKPLSKLSAYKNSVFGASSGSCK